MRTSTNPSTKLPDTLVQNVAHGKRPAATGHRRATPYRAEAPSTPPAEMAPSTAGRGGMSRAGGGAAGGPRGGAPPRRSVDVGIDRDDVLIRQPAHLLRVPHRTEPARMLQA